jgi:trans-2-enoyl-CoA reductase
METEEVADPQGSQVLVKMLACAVNPSDINTIEGTYGMKPSLPAVSGHEGVGVVVAAGPNVKGLRVNDWVIPAQSGFGTWRSHALAAEESLCKIANDIPVEYAATLAVNPATAHLLLQSVQLQAGDVIVQNAANSSVGQIVIQLAKLRGIKTVNIIRDRADYKEVVEQLKALGADVVVSEKFAASAEMKTVLSDLAAPKLALNGVGGASATELVRLLGQGGTMVTYGGMSKHAVTVPTSALIFKDITAKGFWLTRWNQTHSAAERSAILSTLSDLIRAKKLKLAIERKPFAELPKALETANQGFKGRKSVFLF